ncbi:UDP-glucose 4-epimerase GalE [Acuticoccus sp. M5D2P5]|uniref:UDP-glucose 4-epimerase GalE n=1 Tax=Acuticoccus kalidii TaxID=2910977 RepID=UPI001F2FD89F|nr:UDP-glucose 4-epimerase GalE [Acuticoccus kalidii]MCF3931917.1 UDP-glucose 4-epimerase GalE [Acuticoccus kalidii]
MQRVLVTGGAGYIGSHCCKALAAAGYEPVVFDNLSTGHRTFCRFGPLIPGDVRDADELERAFQSMAPVAVMHFAAQSLVGESTARPFDTYDVNVNGTLTLLRTMLNHNVRNIVFSSTCAVYGPADRLPIAETTSLNPISPYGRSKLMVEQIFDDFDAAYGIRSARLRYFNAGGADPSGLIGEWHEPETHLIPVVLDVAMGLRKALKVNGGAYPTSDGTAVRDYIHVDDLAEAHVAALRYLIDGDASVAVNVGTGVGSSVDEVVRAVERVTGRPVATQSGPPRQGDPAELVADPALAKSMFDWRATRDLDTIIADAWSWHQSLRRHETVHHKESV